MAEATIGGSSPITEPTSHFLEVQFDPVDVRLVVEEPKLTVRPGDRVWWIFRGVPSGWTPWIDVEGPAAPVPLESLSQSPWAVQGTIAASGDQGSFGYRARLQRGLGLLHSSGGALVRSAIAYLEVETEVQPRLHEVEVTYRPSGDGGVGSLEVVPQWIKISPGDSVAWSFKSLDSEIASGSWSPRVDFVRFDGPEDPPNLHLGPFSTLTYEGDTVTAAGNSRTSGVYNYVCVLVGRFDDRVISISSPDPAIDRRGDPSGG